MNSDSATLSQWRANIDCKTRNELGLLENPNNVREELFNNNNNLDASVVPAGQESLPGY